MSTEIKAMLSVTNNRAIYYVSPAFFSDENIRSLTAVASELGYKLFHLDGLFVTSADDLLINLSDIMGFPSYFGQNWDALIDCLRDMEWLPAQGYIIIFSHPASFRQKSPTDFKIFLECVETAYEYWISHQIRFLLILEGLPYNEEWQLNNKLWCRMKKRWLNIAILVSYLAIPVIALFITIKYFDYILPSWVFGVWAGSALNVFDAAFSRGEIWRSFSNTRRDKIVLVICQFFWLITFGLVFILKEVYPILILPLVFVLYLLLGMICKFFGSKQLKAELSKGCRITAFSRRPGF